MTGTLIYDSAADRLAIVSGSETRHLHCGDVIEVMKLGIIDTYSTSQWVPARVEHGGAADDWYLVGLYKAGEIPKGLVARTV